MTVEKNLGFHCSARKGGTGLAAALARAVFDDGELWRLHSDSWRQDPVSRATLAEVRKRWIESPMGPSASGRRSTSSTAEELPIDRQRRIAAGDRYRCERARQGRAQSGGFG